MSRSGRLARLLSLFITIADPGLAQEALALGAAYGYLAIGSGSTAESTSSAALTSELSTANGITRQAAAPTNSGAKETWQATFGPVTNATVTLQEIMLVNSATVGAGVPYCRHVYSQAYSLTVGSTVTCSIGVTVTR